MAEFTDFTISGEAGEEGAVAPAGGASAQSQPVEPDHIDQRLSRLEGTVDKVDRTLQEGRRIQAAANLEAKMSEDWVGVEKKVTEAQAAYSRLIEEGASPTDLAAANTKVTEAIAERADLKGKQDVVRAKLKEMAEQGTGGQQQTGDATNQDLDTTNLDSWKSRNSWYEKDREMTEAALSMHGDISREFVVGSQSYFNEIDRRMAERFPDRFGGSQFAGGGQSSMRGHSSPARAAQSAGRRGIRMDSEQVRAMQAMGLTPEQWYNGRQQAVEHGFVGQQPTYGRVLS